GDARLDRAEGRPQLVRDRAQQGGLQLIRPARHGRLVGGLVAPPRRGGELGRDQRREQEQAQAQRFVGAGDGERADRLDEQQVVAQQRRDRGGDRGALPPAASGQDDG